MLGRSMSESLHPDKRMDSPAEEEDKFVLFGPGSDQIPSKLSDSSSTVVAPPTNTNSGSSGVQSSQQPKASSTVVTRAATGISAGTGAAVEQHVELYETVGEMFSAMLNSLIGKVVKPKPDSTHVGPIELFETPGEMFVATLESLQSKISRIDPTVLTAVVGLAVYALFFRRGRRATVVLERRESIHVERLTHE